MSQVEEGPRTALSLVRRHDGRLVADARLDHGRERIHVARGGALQIALAPLEERRPSRLLRGGEQGAFHHLGEAAPALASRQRAEDRRVADDEARLMEGAGEVLSAAQVGSRLSAEPRVDLR